VNWEAIGAVGEVIGALGVIVSLSYLAVQIRATRVAEKRRALESQYLVYNDVRRSLFERAELSRIFPTRSRTMNGSGSWRSRKRCS